MTRIDRSIRSLYRINLIEGEGLGTAYEYHVKLRKLRNFIGSMPKPTKILIAGLPERYGLSMDFFLLADVLGAEAVAVDERPEAVRRAEIAVGALTSAGVFGSLRAAFRKVEKLTALEDAVSPWGAFDLALSSEVLQRLAGDRASYIENLKRLAGRLAVFVPNGDNRAHAEISGLRGISLDDLRLAFRDGAPENPILKSGYLDLPPFPPGLSRSQEKREKAATGGWEAVLMKGLEAYSRLESALPAKLKRKRAHIVYALSAPRP